MWKNHLKPPPFPSMNSSQHKVYIFISSQLFHQLVTWLATKYSYCNQSLDCVKSVRIRSFSGSCFPAFSLNTDQKNSNTDMFYAVLTMLLISLSRVTGSWKLVNYEAWTSNITFVTLRCKKAKVCNFSVLDCRLFINYMKTLVLLLKKVFFEPEKSKKNEFTVHEMQLKWLLYL